MPQSTLHRRQFLIASLCTAGAMSVPSAPVLASAGRTLSFINLHTGEDLLAVYWAAGRHLPAACRRIDKLLRDHRTGEVALISRQLLDLLYALSTRLRTQEPFEVISGYRSPRTNAQLVRTSKGVARKSLHTRGMAIDVRLPGCSLKHLHAAAVSLKLGGVGFYPKSGFVHIDVGRVRYW